MPHPKPAEHHEGPSRWFFASDLHGRLDRYRKLLERTLAERPQALLLGGDLLPSAFARIDDALVAEQGLVRWLARELGQLQRELGAAAPEILLILGNDDPRIEEEDILEFQAQGLWRYLHAGRHQIDGRPVFGYACVPPSPFRLKDWERYDVSRFVDPGSVSPEEGMRTVAVEANEIRYGTIQKDLQTLTGDEDLAPAIFLFHAPPYQSKLDRAALDGKMVDHVPLDIHVGSIAIRRFIENRKPLLTLHGHIHESARLTGAWQDRIGSTFCFSAAHDGPELALIDFDPADPAGARRRLI